MTVATLSAPAPEDAAAAAPSAGDRLRALAALPLSGVGQRGPRLVARLREPERTIAAAYQRLSALPRPVIERSRSAEWLLDNHYVVQRTLRSLKEEFPLDFERKLRLVTDGPARGLALVYVVARELVAIGQGRVDIESLTNAIGQVQAVRSLTIAELWALPALLRLGLLEQLAAAAGAIPGAAPVSGQQRQVEEDAGRVIANVVRSLRTLETADWKQFFEAVSAVDRILAQDPSSLYRQMDFETRDHYRKAIEEVAAGTPDGDEEAVAREAVALSGRHASGRRNHVGHFLVAPGRLELEALLHARPRGKERWRRRVRARPTLTYLGAIGVLSAGGTAAMVFAFLQHASPLIAAVLLLTAVVPLVSAAVTLVNALLTRLLPPRALPKLDFSRGIPAPWRTLVAVPALLSDDEEVDELLAALEIRFLANRDAELHVRAAHRSARRAPPSRCPTMRRWCSALPTASRRSTRATATTSTAHFICFTAPGGGTRAKAAGWDGSASAASSRSSTSSS